MSTNPRDTQFQGFAQQLFYRLPWNDVNIDMEKKGWEERWQTYIAQAAYDFARHVIACTEPINLDRLSPDEHAQRIPDITTTD